MWDGFNGIRVGKYMIQKFNGDHDKCSSVNYSLILNYNILTLIFHLM